jgi:hypothetical protein
MKALEQENVSVLDAPSVKFAAGVAGVSMGLIDQVVSVAQVVSVVGGAIIVIFTLLRMLYNGFKWLTK